MNKNYLKIKEKYLFNCSVYLNLREKNRIYIMYIISKRKKSFQFFTVSNKLKKSMLIENKTTGGKPLENN